MDSTVITNDRVATARPTLGGTKERAFVLLADRRVADVGSSPEAAEFADLHAVEKHRGFVSSRLGDYVLTYSGQTNLPDYRSGSIRHPQSPWGGSGSF